MLAPDLFPKALSLGLIPIDVPQGIEYGVKPRRVRRRGLTNDVDQIGRTYAVCVLRRLATGLGAR